MSPALFFKWAAFFKMDKEERDKRALTEKAEAAKNRAKARPRPVVK